MRIKSVIPIRWLGRCSLLLAWPAMAWSQSNFSPSYRFTTLFGRASIGAEDGPAATARFNQPAGVATDPAGNLYVADTGNHTIRKLSPSGVVSTLAGSPGQPGSTDGVGASARFNGPAGLAVDATGNLYVADTGNQTIRLITPAGVVTTLAGQAGKPGTADGRATDALFSSPRTIAVDGAGNVYVRDSGIRRISAGTVQTIFTSGTVPLADGSSAKVTLDGSALAVDANRRVFFGGRLQTQHFSNSFDYPAILRIDAGGAVSLVASGDPHPGMLSFGLFGQTMRLAADPAGKLLAILYSPGYETLEFQVWRMTTGENWQYVGAIHDGAGADCTAGGLTASPTGEIIFSREDHVLVKLAADGTQVVLAGTPRDYLAGVESLAVDSAGNVWAGAVNAIYPNGRSSSAPELLKVSPDGTVATPLGANIADIVYEINPGPVGVAVDGSDNVYFTDTRFLTAADSHPLLQVAPTGAITANSLSRWYYAPGGFIADASGNLLVPDVSNHVVWKRTPADGWSVLAGREGLAGTDDGSGDGARFGTLGAITADRSGNCYILDVSGQNGTPDRCVIRRISPGGTVSTVSGNLLRKSGRDGLAVEYPGGLAIDRQGAFYLTYRSSATLQRLTATGEMAVIGGAEGQSGSADGSGSAARFWAPGAIVVDAHDNLYLSDGTTIRRGQLAATRPAITAQPQSVTVMAGAIGQLSVTADGHPAPTYQWYFNDRPLTGATSSTLSFTNARAADAGDYTVAVTNELGTVTSSKATLTISATLPPTPTTPAPAPSSGGGGGGGAIEGWFVLALLALGATHQISEARKTQNKSA